MVLCLIGTCFPPFTLHPTLFKVKVADPDEGYCIFLLNSIVHYFLQCMLARTVQHTRETEKKHKSLKLKQVQTAEFRRKVMSGELKGKDAKRAQKALSHDIHWVNDRKALLKGGKMEGQHRMPAPEEEGEDWEEGEEWGNEHEEWAEEHHEWHEEWEEGEQEEQEWAHEEWGHDEEEAWAEVESVRSAFFLSITISPTTQIGLFNGHELLPRIKLGALPVERSPPSRPTR